MRAFIAALFHETNSFSPIPTSRASFETFEYHRPTAGIVDERCRELNGYGGFVRESLARGHQVYASTYASAQPSGPCSTSGYESLRDEILDDLRHAGKVDMVLLFLHGAQMAVGYDDCEGDLITRARAIVGPAVFIGVLLDLHANVSSAMVEASSAIAACRHYPHIDFDDRAVHLLRLGEACVAAGVRPVQYFRRVPMLGMFYTTEPRMGRVNDDALALQNREGVLSVSLMHGFSFTDNADIGAGVLVVTARQRDGVERELSTLARSFFAARDETRKLRRSVHAILDEIEAAASDAERRPFVIADACDNAGGGAGSDANFILASILERGLSGYAIALVWDPVAAQFASDAGVGARFRIRLGGKTGPQAGDPLDLDVEVLSVRSGGSQHGIGFRWPLGLVAALKVGGNVVIVNTIRNQVFSPTCFTDFGVDLHAMRALVVKSSQHFRDQFAPIAREIFYCETPAAMPLDVSSLPYTKVRRPIWPLDEVVVD